MNEDVSFESNDANVMWLNEQHEKIQKGDKTLLNIALEMGERLVKLQECHSGTGKSFNKWFKGKDFKFSLRTARRYMKLFREKDKISPEDGLTDAYRKIDEKDDSEDDVEKEELQVTEKQELQATEKEILKVTEKAEPQAAEKGEVQVFEKQEPQVVEKQILQVSEKEAPKVSEKQESQVDSNLQTLSSETGLISRLEIIRNEISKCEKLEELADIVTRYSNLTEISVSEVRIFQQTLKRINKTLSEVMKSISPNNELGARLMSNEAVIKKNKPKAENAIQRIAKNYNNLISNLNNIWGC